MTWCPESPFIPTSSATVNVGIPFLYLFLPLKGYHRDLGETPPPPPRNFVGRDELIERLVDLINTGTPVALIGAGGIGKTSIALTLLEDGSIKDKFGNNRRFVRCDEVRSYRRFLRQLSKVIGAGIENPPDLTALRPFLSSVNILLIVDNAEIILDPHTPEAPALYSAVEELSRIKTISLLITTRISTIPATCEQLEVSPLSMISAREAFYNIFTNRQRTPGVDSLLRQLDFHPLSITLLATVATQNRWDHSRLIREWKQHRISLLQTHHTLGLSTAIELSLSSPTFTSLGPDARDILCVIAVFPQGINQHESGWIFPTVSNVHGIIDMFYVLSLTHRNHEFVTMLAPIQEYLQLDGSSHSLFSRVRNRYLTRIRNIAHGVGHGHVPPQEMRWFVSEEANIDFLLVLSMRTNPDSMDILRICGVVTQIALFHPPRATFNGQHAIQPISDRLRYPLLSITWVKNLVGYLESTYSHLISLEDGRTRWASRIVCILLSAAVCNTSLGHSTKAISQTEEALGICVGLQDTFLHALCYRTLARLSERAGSLNEATGALLEAKELHLREGDQVGVFECHINLSNIYKSRADLDGAKENLIAAPKIMYRLKKRADLAATFRSLALVCEEQNDHINARRYRRWTCILVRKVLPDLRIAEEALENSSLALIRGDLETAKADAKVALKTFKKIGCTGGQEEAISVLDVISSELNLQESSDPTTQARSDTA